MFELRLMLAFLLSVGMCMIVPGFGLAQDKTDGAEGQAIAHTEAQALFYSGVGAYRAKAYGQAVLAFQKLLNQSQNPDLLFNIARAYEGMGHQKAARRWYEAYLKGQPKDETAVKQKLEALAETGFEIQRAGGTTQASSKAKVTPQLDAGRRRVALGWLAGGLGAIALGSSIAFGAQAVSAESDAQNSRDFDSVSRFNLEASQAAIRADLMLGGALIGIGTAVYLWWFADESRGVPDVEGAEAKQTSMNVVHGQP